jgi:hypothetical protein
VLGAQYKALATVTDDQFAWMDADDNPALSINMAKVDVALSGLIKAIHDAQRRASLGQHKISVSDVQEMFKSALDGMTVESKTSRYADGIDDDDDGDETYGDIMGDRVMVGIDAALVISRDLLGKDQYAFLEIPSQKQLKWVRVVEKTPFSITLTMFDERISAALSKLLSMKSFERMTPSRAVTVDGVAAILAETLHGFVC